jgi:hypothetical protein
MKYFKSHNEFLNEAKLSKIHNAAKKGSYPVTLVVIENGKVVKQELVGTPQIVPAAFNQLKKEYPKATVHVESKTGERLFSESTITEAKELSKKEVRDLKIKINNARTIGKYFTKDEVEFLQSLFESEITEAVNESNQARLTHLRKFGIAPNNQPQTGAYIKQVAKPGKFFVDWKDAFDLGDVALEFIKPAGSESVFDIIDLKTMKRTGKQYFIKKGDLKNLRTTYGVRVNESITEGKFNKRSLMKAMKRDDGFIQLGNGQEYIIYNPNNGNDDNADMWDDKVIFALDQDGEEHEIKYSDIVSYNESRKINLKADHLSSEEYQKAKKLKDFDKGDWEWNSKSGLYDRVNEAIDVNDPVLIAYRATRRDLPKLKIPKVKSRRLSFDKYMDLLDARLDIDQQIKDLRDEMAQTLRDMEQEAEPEGGEVADRYGSTMMDQEKEYTKLMVKKDKIMARIDKHRMA